MVVEYGGDLKPQRRATDGDPWYTNRDLFEMINSLKSEINQTTSLLRQYNGLGGRMDRLEQALLQMVKTQEDCMTRQSERVTIGKAVREWGGWIIAVVGFGAKLLGYW